jgi:hypothetical protein
MPPHRTRFLLVVSLAVFSIAGLVGYLARGATSDPAQGATPPPDESGIPSGTRRMAALLQQINAAQKPGQNLFMNAARVGLLDDILSRNKGNPPPGLPMERAKELLNAGRVDDAIAALAELEATARAQHVDAHSKEWVELRLRQAVAQLRRAESENCIVHHNPKSCLFPISGTGVHGQQRGSRAAAAVLESLLSENPDQMQARWLLNIAYMTLGEYPAGVPKRFLLEPKLFESEADIGRFPDVAASVGLDVDDLAGGSIVDDFDGDGDLDLMTSSSGIQAPLRYFRNNGDGTFSERTGEARLTGLVGGLNITQTDYDNDGRLDVLVLRGGWMGKGGRYPKSLLHNDGNGTFSDVTEEAGLLSFHPSQTAVWRDFDGDGWLDLFVGNESGKGDPQPCELFRNNRDGTFTEQAAEAGVALTEWVKAVASGDIDNDGRPDLYLSVRGGPNRLFHNLGPAASSSGAATPSGKVRFEDVTAAAGVQQPIWSFPTWFFDYDNDGWEDIFVSGYGLEDPGDIARDVLGMSHKSERPRLYRNRGDGTFEDVTRTTGLWRLLMAMGSNYGDFDNDGWLDFYLGTGDPDLARLLPNRAFRNAGGRSFQDITTSAGLGHLQKGHGVSFADLDNDGDQDVYQVVGGAVEADHFRNALFENPGHGHHWIKLKLTGVTSNRAAIGARIKVVVHEGQSERAIYKTVSSGGSFGSSPLRQEIGLGDAVRIDRVEIRWPWNAAQQVLQGLALDRCYEVREGESTVKETPLRRVRLGGGPAKSS